MIAYTTYRSRALLLVAFGLTVSICSSQTRGRWQADTTRIGVLLRQSDAQWQLWHLDSTAHFAGQGLALAETMLAEAAAANDSSHKMAVLLLKASSLGYLGLSGTAATNLAQLKEAERIYEQLGEPSRGLRVKESIAHWYHRSGEYQQAVLQFRKIAQAHEASGDIQRAADVLNQMGVSYRLQGEYGAAIDCHLKALTIIEPTGQLERIGMTHTLIGSAQGAGGSRSESLEHMHKARSLFEKAHKSTSMAMAYNDLGASHQFAGSLDSALYWHQRSAELRTKNGEHNGIGDSNLSIGAIRMKQGQPDAARASYQVALDAYRRVGNPIGMSSVYAKIADLEVEVGRPDTALADLLRALDLFEGPGNHQELAPLHFLIARILGTVGDWSGAIASYEEGIRHATAVSAMRNLMIGQEALYELHAKLGDYRTAYHAHEKFIAARDSVRIRADRSRVVRLMMKHDLEQHKILQQAKDDALRASERAELDDKRLQMYVYIAGVALFLILALALVARLRFITRVRKRLERQRNELQEAMARAERSEKFKERFLANMSHEIRTPMNAIMGMSGIMLRNEHLPKQEAQLEAVRDNADRLLRTLNDILDLSKMDAGMLQPESIALDPRMILERVLAAWRSTCEGKGVRLSIEVAPEVPHIIMGDPTRLEQVLSNLVQTAIKFTDSGSIHVQASAGGTTGDKFLLCFSVKDTGVGMSPARMEGIFGEINQDYSVGRKKRGDIGLGLTISKRLTELMGGTMEISSEEGKGSTFKATIPFTIATTAFKAEATMPSHRELRNLRILLAEDNAFNVMVAQDELNDAIPGVVVDVAVDGRQALSMVKEHAYDVVLMDVQMPEMNGYDATKAIRSLPGNMSHVPIIAMTANAMQADLDRCKEAGMNGYVPKPFKREELLLALQRALSTSRAEA